MTTSTELSAPVADVSWPRRNRLGLGVFATCLVVLVVWWLAFFPVLVSPDSLIYVFEATTNHWSTDFSVAYDALIWVSLQTTHSVAAVVLVQMITAAAALAYVATGLQRIGARSWAAAAVAPAALLLPSLGTFPLYLWKDVPFTIAGLWLFGLFLRVVECVERDEGAWTSPRMRALVRWSFVAALLMCLFRNNAFLFIVISSAGVVLVWRRAAARLVGALLLGCVVAAVLTVAVVPLFGVDRARSDLVLGPAYDDIAYVFQRDPGALSGSERRTLAAVAPLAVWRAAGNCYTADDLSSNLAVSRDSAGAHGGQLFAMWLRLVVHHPIAMATARMCRGYIAWSPVAGPATKGATIFPLTYEKHSRFLTVPNPTWRRALEPDAPNAGLHHFLQAYDLDSYSAEPVVWRGATWAYAGYAVVLLAWSRTRRRPLLALAALPFGVQLGVLLDNPNQLVRYMILPLYLGVLLLPVLTIRSRSATAAGGEDPRERP